MNHKPTSASQHHLLPASQPSKIRVVHLVYSFATGGMEKGICTTINHGSSDFEHIIVCLTYTGEMARRLPAGIPVIEMAKNPGNSLSFLFRLARLLKRLQPAVIHTRNWSGIDGVFAAQLAGISTIVHGEHGWGMEDPYGKNVKRRWIRRIADVSVRHYTCVSKQMKDWLERDIKVNRSVTQIYNGIDTHTFRPVGKGEKHSLRRQLDLSASAFIIGVVARLDPIKNHRCLFEVFQRVKDYFPDVELLVVGDGPERKTLQGLAGEGIRFLGNRDDVALIYRALDLFVLPSNNEGISNTILEAMASGLPVVASRVGGNPELIKNGSNGSLFKAGNVKELEEKMMFYIKNQAIAQSQGINATITTKSRFSVSQMVTSYERVWRDAWMLRKA